MQRAEAALEAEHGSFVRLSQLSCELVARLEKSNGSAANDVRRRLDTVTQRWDNLVARIEEHSRTLVQSGKADVRQLRKVEPLASSSGIEHGTKADRVVKPNETSLKVTTLEELAAEAETTSETEAEEAKNQVATLVGHSSSKFLISSPKSKLKMSFSSRNKKFLSGLSTFIEAVAS
ncbi:unnamed protein product [Haemonchus placei]|uniref:Uncharacterized protein n=1 Tax=Haemonchus placei TaxID=6290 RepID=A0A3P7TH48_HAEPC|nr:unnamed protein product [Haemonchus placei]